MSKTPCKILFVCTGNTCRSPMAEGLMRKATSNAPHITAHSAGIAAQNGSPASIETQNILLQHGIDFHSFRSQQLTSSLVHEADYIFCMSRMHREAILSQLPEHREKVLRLGEFMGEQKEMDIADPFGLGEPAYKEVEKQLLRAIENIFTFISENEAIEKHLKE